ncbi:unnamed protein product [Rotaria sp. Silwood1]|nr:unnamed protein product [Rotaria sp. Silwood1]CAF1638271.1 unnamed protein product [Rotaria sp. Silwood1]CAF3886219.1 unnamed protein product [Rotaria sp. Silwood1]CAF3891878.1 unnamed protein product [Rotaria sp. Silwood1]CAF3940015.1 unnamed protein product [Rotaria sp. Silwood1]
MENLLHSFTSLPNLSSLAIPIAQGSNTNTIYNLIFQLPVLKYCKMTFEENISFESLPRSTKLSNSIEHLVINGACHYAIIDALLSYVPQLRRLSINYLRKCFTLTGEPNLDKNVCHEKTIFDSVHHVIIQDERVIVNSSKYFPNANELTIFNQRASCSHWNSTYYIDGIIPVIQITKLTIDYSHHPFNKLVDLLYCIPNIQTLIFKQLSLPEMDYFLLQESEKFRLVSNQNKIKSITFSLDYSLRKIKLFMNLCPKLQQLTIGMADNCLEITVQFLLLETKRTICHLSSLCIFGMNTISNKKLKTLIESKNLLDDYSIKIVDRNFYLWW